MDRPIISTAFVGFPPRLDGTITLAFGRLEAGNHALLSLKPLFSTLTETFREPCRELTEKEAIKPVMFDWPPQKRQAGTANSLA